MAIATSIIMPARRKVSRMAAAIAAGAAWAKSSCAGAEGEDCTHHRCAKYQTCIPREVQKARNTAAPSFGTSASTAVLLAAWKSW